MLNSYLKLIYQCQIARIKYKSDVDVQDPSWLVTFRTFLKARWTTPPFPAIIPRLLQTYISNFQWLNGFNLIMCNAYIPQKIQAWYYWEHMCSRPFSQPTSGMKPSWEKIPILPIDPISSMVCIWGQEPQIWVLLIEHWAFTSICCGHHQILHTGPNYLSQKTRTRPTHIPDSPSCRTSGAYSRRWQSSSHLYSPSYVSSQARRETSSKMWISWR